MKGRVKLGVASPIIISSGALRIPVGLFEGNLPMRRGRRRRPAATSGYAHRAKPAVLAVPTRSTLLA